MSMTPAARKLLLTAHVTASVGWLGALAVFLAHAVLAQVSEDAQIVRATSIAMGLTAWLVIMPLSLATLVTGVAQALGTAWGLFRHYWILFKLMLTVLATIVLLLKLGPISVLAEAAASATFSNTDLIGLRRSLTFHAIGGMVVLLAAAALGIYKPEGLTRFGRARQGDDTGSRVTYALPRWVKVCGGIAAALILLVGIMMSAGDHGPGSHASLGA
jgi:hypothetical protein